MVSALGLWIESSEFEHWSGSLCCVLGQDTLLSQCLSPPRSKMDTGKLSGQPDKNAVEVTDGLASHPGEKQYS